MELLPLNILKYFDNYTNFLSFQVEDVKKEKYTFQTTYFFNLTALHSFKFIRFCFLNDLMTTAFDGCI